MRDFPLAPGRRSERITFRVSPDELAWWNEFAAALGASNISAAIRTSGITAAAGLSPLDASKRASLRELISQVRGACHNANQATRAVHAACASNDMLALEDAVTRLAGILAEDVLRPASEALRLLGVPSCAPVSTAPPKTPQKSNKESPKETPGESRSPSIEVSPGSMSPSSNTRSPGAGSSADTAPRPSIVRDKPFRPRVYSGNDRRRRF